MTMGIYKIINVVNNKFYVGSAVDFGKRRARHRNQLYKNAHPNPKLQAAWNKYGERSFIFVLVQEVKDRGVLLKTENIFLAEHVGKDYCYNINFNAESPMLGRTGELHPHFGKPMSEGQKAKISAALSGEKHPNWGVPTPEHVKDALRESNTRRTGWTHTEEAKAKISEASAARVQTDLEKQRRSHTMMGHKVSTECRAKISEAMQGEKHMYYGQQRSEEFCAKIRRAVVVTRPDGTEEEYPSIQRVREELALKPPTINRALKSGNALVKGKYIGWKFRYVVQS